MRAMLCRVCNGHQEAADEEKLSAGLLAHLEKNHPEMEVDGKQVWEMVADCSYRYERVAVYADGSGPDEEFGPEPY